MGRLMHLTCDHCGRSLDLPEDAALPLDWMEVRWVEPVTTEDCDCGLDATFCGWRCAATFCAQMAQQQLLQSSAYGRRPQ